MITQNHVQLGQLLWVCFVCLCVLHTYSVKWVTILSGYELAMHVVGPSIVVCV